MFSLACFILAFIYCVVLSFLPSSMYLSIHSHTYTPAHHTQQLTITDSPSHSPSHQLHHQLGHCRACSQSLTHTWTLTVRAQCDAGHGAVCEDGGGSGRASSHPGGGHVLPSSEWQGHHAGLCHCSGRAACQERSHTAHQVSSYNNICRYINVIRINLIHILTRRPYSMWQKEVHVAVACWICQALLLCRMLGLRKAEISCRQAAMAGRLCTPHIQCHNVAK